MNKKIFLVFDKTSIRFIAVGIANTVLGSILMFVLHNATELGYWLSSGIACFFLTVFSFFVNKYFTFAVNEWSLFIVLAFIVNIAICYIIAYGVAKPIINFFLRHSLQMMHENIALFTGMCLFSGLNYLGQRYIVFNVGDEI